MKNSVFIVCLSIHAWRASAFFVLANDQIRKRYECSIRA